MTTDAILSNVLVQVNPNIDGSPTPAYLTIQEVTGLSGLGETAPLLRATHFQSTSEEYIAGLADGEEFTIECNRVHESPSAQDKMVSYKGLTKRFQVTDKDLSVSPNTSVVYTFDAVILGWTLGPQLGDVSKINYTCKISGGITVT